MPPPFPKRRKKKKKKKDGRYDYHVMGIAGLLKFLGGISEPAHIREYSGKSLAVDVSAWLYRGAYGCALGMLEDPRNSDGYVSYCLDRVALLRRSGVRPYLVFDGRALPAKAAERSQRSRRKKSKRAEAVRFLQRGDRINAERALQACLDVTSDMRSRLILACKELGIEYVVAPYEADAQLAYLFREGLVDGVISEDSDLLAFGAREVLFKMDSGGHVQRVRLDRVGEVRVKGNKKRVHHMKGWSHADFLRVCILGGCDYLPRHEAESHIKGVGLKTALKVLAVHRNLHRALQALARSGHNIPEGYAESIERAELTFAHQLCYDPRTRSIVPLTPYSEEIRKRRDADPHALDFAGPYISPACGIALAKGECDPETLEQPAGPLSQLSPRTLGYVRHLKRQFRLFVHPTSSSSSSSSIADSFSIAAALTSASGEAAVKERGGVNGNTTSTASQPQSRHSDSWRDSDNVTVQQQRRQQQEGSAKSTTITATTTMTTTTTTSTLRRSPRKHAARWQQKRQQQQQQQRKTKARKSGGGGGGGGDIGGDVGGGFDVSNITSLFTKRNRRLEAGGFLSPEESRTGRMASTSPPKSGMYVRTTRAVAVPQSSSSSSEGAPIAGGGGSGSGSSSSQNRGGGGGGAKTPVLHTTTTTTTSNPFARRQHNLPPSAAPRSATPGPLSNFFTRRHDSPSKPGTTIGSVCVYGRGDGRVAGASASVVNDCGGGGGGGGGAGDGIEGGRLIIGGRHLLSQFDDAADESKKEAAVMIHAPVHTMPVVTCIPDSQEEESPSEPVPSLVSPSASGGGCCVGVVDGETESKEIINFVPSSSPIIKKNQSSPTSTCVNDTSSVMVVAPMTPGTAKRKTAAANFIAKFQRQPQLQQQQQHQNKEVISIPLSVSSSASSSTSSSSSSSSSTATTIATTAANNNSAGDTAAATTAPGSPTIVRRRKRACRRKVKSSV